MLTAVCIATVLEALSAATCEFGAAVARPTALAGSILGSALVTAANLAGSSDGAPPPGCTTGVVVAVALTGAVVGVGVGRFSTSGLALRSLTDHSG